LTIVVADLAIFHLRYALLSRVSMFRYAAITRSEYKNEQRRCFA